MKFEKFIILKPGEKKCIWPNCILSQNGYFNANPGHIIVTTRFTMDPRYQEWIGNSVQVKVTWVRE